MSRDGKFFSLVFIILLYSMRHLQSSKSAKKWSQSAKMFPKWQKKPNLLNAPFTVIEEEFFFNSLPPCQPSKPLVFKNKSREILDSGKILS